MTARAGEAAVLGALIRFEVVRRARARPQQVVALLYAVFVPAAYGAGSLGWVDDAGLALLVFTLYAGFGIDRSLAYDELLVPNFVAPNRYVAAKVASLAIALVAIGGLVGATVLLASAGSGDHALWHAALFLLLALYFLPLVLLVESAMETRLPLLAAVIVLFVVLGIVAWVLGPEFVRQAFGFSVIPYRLETLGPLARRALVVSPLLTLILLPLVRRRLPGLGGR
ncbi:MAG: hypothetical protein KY397_00105 [Gemmatimonadetes bacterium]|nr:hypothetical protein [Gemmatimonadota bacterium]